MAYFSLSPLLLLLLAVPTMRGLVSWLLGLALLACVGLIAAWYRQQRKPGAAATTEAPAQEPAGAAPLHVYSVEKVLGAAGTEYGQHLLSQLEQLNASLTPPPPLELSTAPKKQPETTDAPGSHEAESGASADQSGEHQAAPPAGDGHQPAGSPAAPPATEPPTTGSGDQEIEEFSRQVSAPPELKPAPTKRFSSRKAVVNPEAMAQLQQARATTFLPTHTGQHIPMLAERD